MLVVLLGVERSYCSAPNTITGTASSRRKADVNRAKLCELFIDPKLVDLKRQAMANASQNGEKVTKKSEEIWVKRVNDPARRSFRVVSPACLFLFLTAVSQNLFCIESWQRL